MRFFTSVIHDWRISSFSQSMLARINSANTALSLGVISNTFSKRVLSVRYSLQHTLLSNLLFSPEVNILYLETGRNALNNYYHNSNKSRKARIIKFYFLSIPPRISLTIFPFASLPKCFITVPIACIGLLNCDKSMLAFIHASISPLSAILGRYA